MQGFVHLYSEKLDYLWPETGTGLIDPYWAENVKRTGGENLADNSTPTTPVISQPGLCARDESVSDITNSFHDIINSIQDITNWLFLTYISWILD